jgi:hypothetical protein
VTKAELVASLAEFPEDAEVRVCVAGGASGWPYLPVAWVGKGGMWDPEANLPVLVVE